MPKRHEVRQRLAEHREELAKNGGPLGGPLVVMAKETLDIIERGGYAAPQDGHYVNISVDLRSSIEGSSFHAENEAPAAILDTRASTNIAFEHATCFGAAAQRLQPLEPTTERLRRVCVLNFASAKHPGGGFKTGAVAQEESLARASGLYPTLTRHMGMYGHVRKGLYSDRMIYSPGVPVFRDDAGALLHEPFLCDVVSAAACNLRAVNKRDAACLDETMRRRTRKILSLAQARGVNCIVLGAWGTGVFRMDPADVAEWFEEALHEVYFDEVVFAIPDARKLSLFEAAFAAARSSRC
eukprot:gnl/TRDRNA2_/TRDRNA2_58529_c0_seq1.p1 gnl/TRDRNA2_/TRDRNA2_58529_c0~~gnl/TRDRNA2_/TRDRNA2_58529_c0_seq1.p1  ORF type:complete len:297 (+),score=54.67 gnl/TRDRNA2_/TRDRNA2_58529_c0_seq1:61-951(+)